MSKADFEMLVGKVGPRVCRQNTNMRLSIRVATRLAIVLRFLATGDSFKSLMYTFRVHYTTISQIVPDVLQALIEGLKEFIKNPPRGYAFPWHKQGPVSAKYLALGSNENKGLGSHKTHNLDGMDTSASLFYNNHPMGPYG
ncbi:hypothetical protein GE061_002542 [Apolygus lucorum]|uniref:Transposase Helix-turn-helix domain-containing protein n=1 Tax=Apolygus lucorum TaxID=248454 RepID=A0A8S9X5C8_APOLU|nr:hypothetical protein GE061_002542 [Apolygus lucorum]